MARTSRVISKNWLTLFLFILLGIVLGSFLGHFALKVSFLSWLDNGLNFSIGDNNGTNVVTLNLLDVLVISFGLRVKITIASVLGAAAAVFLYKKL